MSSLYDIGLIATLESKLEQAHAENARLREDLGAAKDDLSKALAHTRYAHAQMDVFERAYGTSQHAYITVAQVRRWLGGRP